MLYDKTTIAVQERSILEIADVSLHVIRDHWRPLLFYLALAVVPLMLLNYFLVGWMANPDYSEGSLMRYIWSMGLLVAAEAQIATIFLTFYLGQALFGQTMTVREVLRESAAISIRMLWCHGVVRAVLAVWALYFVVIMTNNGNFNGWLETFLIPAIVIYSLLVRSFRPFVTELLALEKNQFRAKGNKAMTLRLRSKSLHGPIAAEAFGRAIFTTLIAVLFVLSLVGAMLIGWSYYSLIHSEVFTLNHILFPLCLWMAAGFMFVIRFLSYLDTRTRQEGWEVELRLRAEAAELQKQMGESHG